MVYKGCQRRMIVLKKPDGDYFDEAYFILKENYSKNKPASEESMVKEANRILAKYSLIPEKRAAFEKKQIPVLNFLFGVATGIGLVWIVNLIFS